MSGRAVCHAERGRHGRPAEESGIVGDRGQIPPSLRSVGMTRPGRARSAGDPVRNLRADSCTLPLKRWATHLGKLTRLLLLIGVVMLVLASHAPAQQIDYARPVDAAPTPEDIGEDYVLPIVQRPLPRMNWQETVDLGVLLAALGLSTWIVLRRRKRREQHPRFRRSSDCVNNKSSIDWLASFTSTSNNCGSDSMNHAGKPRPSLPLQIR